MAKRSQQDVIQNYVLPLALAIVILAVSQLLNLVNTSNLLEACGLVAIVIIGLFIGQYVAFRALRIQERDVLYGVLSTISFSRSNNLPLSGVLTEKDVLGLESTARQVWVFAYDLNYERYDKNRSPFTNAVATNLSRGVRYIYLIPDAPEIIGRAERMRDYLRQYATSPKQLEFRIACSPPLFNQFSVTLYNPDAVDGADPGEPSGEENGAMTIAVFFPHAKDFEEADQSASVPFIGVREPRSLEIQEKFEVLLKESKALRVKPKGSVTRP